MWFETSLILALSYGFGSIPVALLLSRLMGSPDPRTISSGNIGATNMLRTGRRDLACATLLLDISKGALAVSMALTWTPALSPWGCSRSRHRPCISYMALTFEEAKA